MSSSHAAALACLLAFSAFLAPSPVAANEAERIEALEDQLGQALALIESLQRQVTELKQERAAPADAVIRPTTTGDSSTGETSVSLEERVLELEERLEETEELTSDIDARVGSRTLVKAFDAERISFGGFLDLAATHASGEDSSKTSFNRMVLELLFGAELSERWDFFAAQAFVRKTAPDFSDRRNPDFADLGSVATDTVLAWFNYRHSDVFNVRVGRFITPHGIINIEHFPAIALDPEQPQFLRPFIGQTMFPNFSDGIQLHGRKFLGDEGNSVSYALYGSEYAANTTEWNGGGRLAFGFGKLGTTIGINAAHGSRSEEVDSDYTLYGLDIFHDRGKLLWKTEAFATDEDAGGDRFAFYTQPAWRVSERGTLFYRFDYLDRAADPVTKVELGRSIEHVLGYTHRPHPNAHLRAVLTHREFDDTDVLAEADAWLLQLSATLSF